MESIQRELNNSITNMVSFNRQNTQQQPRARLIVRYNPLEKSKVLAKKKLEESCPNECSICMEITKYKDAVCTDCNHYYCNNCWNEWMNSTTSNKKCPTCSKDMPKTTSYKARKSSKIRPINQPVMIIEDDE